MEEYFRQRNNKKKYLVIMGAIVLVALLVGVTYAFFNYTRTGGANTVGTGKIKFTSNVGEASRINLQNMFPITNSAYESEALSNGVPVTNVPANANFGRYVVTISGETTYVEGIDFEVTAREVQLTTGTVTLPINVKVYAVDNANTTLGDTAISANQYINAQNPLTNGAVLASGHIGTTVESTTAPIVTFTGTRYQATVTIDAYLDDSRILITDTPEENEALQQGKTVISTTDWNNLSNGTGSPLSFKVRVESNEGKHTPTLSLSSSSGSIAPNENTTVTISTNGDGELSCQSSSELIATCSVSGTTLTVNGVAAGSASITVNQTAGANYAARSTTYAVTVEVNNVTPISCLIYEENNNEITITGYNNSDSDCTINGPEFNFVIPATIDNKSVTKIGDEAFSYMNITSLSIPNSVTEIGEYAFDGNLFSHLEIPSSVTTIGNNAFQSCSNLTTLTLHDGLISIGNQAFSDNAISSLLIPSTVTSIGQEAFYINNLTSLTIPNNLTVIGDGAFSGNDNLTDAIVDITDIPDYFDWDFGLHHLETLTIGPNVRTIGDNAFGQTRLSQIEIPSTVLSWKCSAFPSRVSVDNKSSYACVQ